MTRVFFPEWHYESHRGRATSFVSQVGLVVSIEEADVLVCGMRLAMATAWARLTPATI
jgi:hypothetical protein